MYKKGLVLFVLLIPLAISSCGLPGISANRPGVSIFEPIVRQSTDLSWEEGRITFFSNRPALYNGHRAKNTSFVFIMDEKGEEIRTIEGTSRSSEFPIAWSPDGQKMAVVTFWEETDSHCIVLMDAISSNCLVEHGYAPSWSPDGEKIAYYNPPKNSSPGVSGPASLHLVDIKTKESRELVSLPVSSFDANSTWSPDSSMLAYEVRLSDQPSDPKPDQIWIYDFSTRETRYLTDGILPSWSKNGNEIVYIRNHQLMIYSLTTGHEEQILSEFKNVLWPSWSPDGKRLLFAAFDDEDNGIFCVDWGTKEVRQILNDRYSTEAPSWRP